MTERANAGQATFHEGSTCQRRSVPRWGPIVLILWFLAVGVAAARPLGLNWVSIVSSLFLLSLMVLIAHIWRK